MAAAPEGSDGDSSDVLYTDDIQQPLDEFVCTHTLPQSVSVTRGSFMSPEAMIVRGDVLLLRAMAPASVSLSFADPVSGLKREIVVSPDVPVKFLALPPKDSILSDPDSVDGSGKGRPVSMVTYPTVTDLLMDCPTYFEANSTYDDPYLPGFSVKPGDRFRFVKVVRDASGEKMERLQCRTESGELVCLSLQCKGNFTVLSDNTCYTLRELTDLAKVPRRLKLAPENQDLQVSGCDTPVAELVPEIPLGFSGVLTMSRPEEMLEASPWDSPDVTWHIPLNANLHVRLYSAAEYEEPVVSRRIKPEPLANFVNEHERKFPVHAILFSYTTPPEVISSCLRDSRDIIVHEKLHTQKLFVKDSNKDDYFAIDESVKISFVEIPQTLSSIFEMMSLPLGSQVRVLADVAADFPEPFVLRYGDVLQVTKHECSSWKFKHSSTGDVPIVKCERMVQGGKAQKLKLPLDLDVSLVVMSDPSQLRVTRLADIFSGKEDIPTENVSVLDSLEGNGGSYSPLPSSLQVLQVLTEKELLISPLSSTAAISPRIQTCVRIPLRHQVQLGLKRKLEFPDGYFIMPPKNHVVSLGVEPVLESEYEELVQARKIATEYEDVEVVHTEQEEDTRSLASSSGRSRHAVNVSSEPESIPRSTSTGALEWRRHKDRVKRISRALNPKNWRLGRGAAAGDQEGLPPPVPPVSGILTLSLQPSQAPANDYTGDMGEGPGTGDSQFKSVHQGAEVEGVEDGPYEAIDISPGIQPTTRSKSLQPEHVEHLAPFVSPSTHLSASAGNINRAGTGAASYTAQHSNDKNMSSPTERADRAPPSLEELEPDPLRQRGKREENCEGTSKGGRRRRRKTEPNIKLVEERPKKASSPDHGKEPCEEDLERAPPVRHKKTRAPADRLGAPERMRKMQSPDKGIDGSHHPPDKSRNKTVQPLKDSYGAETPTTPEKHRKAQLNEDNSVNEHHRYKTQSSEKESEKQSRHKDSSTLERQRKMQLSDHPSRHSPAPERHRKTQSPGHPSESSPAPERRRKPHSHDHPLEVSPSPGRHRKTRSPDHPSEISPATERQTKPHSPDHPSELSPSTERHGKTRSPDHPSENSPATERQRKTQSPDYPSEHPPAPARRRNKQSPDGSSENTHSKATDFASPDFHSKHPNLVERSQESKSPNSSPQQERTARLGTSPGSDSPSEHLRNKAGKPPSPGSNSSGTFDRQRKKQTSDDDIKQKPSSQTPRNCRGCSPDPKPKDGEDCSSNPERPKRQQKKQDISGDNQGNKSVDSPEFSDKGSGHCSPTSAGNSSQIREDVSKRDKAVREKPAVPPKPVIDPRPGAAKVAKGHPPPVAPPRNRGARIGSVEAEMFSEGDDVKPVLGRRRTP